MGIQIFGARKCAETRKAERWFKERGIAFQSIDLAEKGISPGELRSVIASTGKEGLIDRDSSTYKIRGLAHLDYDVEEEILANPLLLKTPIVRDGRRSSIGYVPEVWKGWQTEG